jgi:eukaryotic-like serine/threonine-protein kinase
MEQHSPSRLRALFDRLADMRPADRSVAMDDLQLCEKERHALLQLLASESDHSIFSRPAVEWAELLDGEDEDPAHYIGRSAGPYTIERFLGKGGTSVVFLATRQLGEISQQVALKLLHNGLYSADARRRFRREQSILSRLCHPNIAHLIDAGILETGTPFIAMEYVAGMDVVSHATSHALSARPRLRLLIDICRAIDAAHRTLIVHRDLKPSNVLVTSNGQVKVLDFGIARLVDDEESLTTTRHIALTPGYAAPEQFDSGPAMTSTDVYSLGVLAGELLLGVRFGPDATWPQTSAADRSTAKRNWRTLDADLTRILRVSLASDPGHRYTSAGHLADDIERYLRNEPLQVAPVSAGYRLRKFAARHRGAVIAAALLFSTNVVGIASVLWQSTLVGQQAQRANTTRDFLVSVFKSAGAELPIDRRPSVDDIVDQASQRLTASPSAQNNDALGNAQRVDLLLTLTKIERSMGAFERASILLAKVDDALVSMAQPDSPPAFEARILRAAIAFEGAQTDTHPLSPIAILAPLQEQMLLRRDATSVDGLVVLAKAYHRAARDDEAIALARHTVEDAAKSTAPDVWQTAANAEVGILLDAQHYEDAAYRAQEALQLWHRQGEPITQAVITLHGDAALARESIGDIAGADAAYHDAIALGDRFFDKPNPTMAWYVGIYGTFLIAQGRLDEADPLIDRGFKMRRAVFGDTDSRTLYGVAGVAKLMLARDQYSEAIETLTRGIDTCSANAIRNVVCARLLALRARAFSRRDDFTHANADLRDALSRQSAISGENAPGYAWMLAIVVEIQCAAGDFKSAIETADRALAINSNAHGAMLLQANLEIRFYRAKSFLEMHRDDEALSEITAVESSYAEHFPNAGLRWEMTALKASTLAAVGRSAQARDSANEAILLSSRIPHPNARLVDKMRGIVRSST